MKKYLRELGLTTGIGGLLVVCFFVVLQKHQTPTTKDSVVPSATACSDEVFPREQHTDPIVAEYQQQRKEFSYLSSCWKK